MHREESDTSADGIAIVTSSSEIYTIAKRLISEPDTITRDETIVLAAYLVSHFENDP